ncbi:LOW QUALITY PROTEIN: signal recognition particle subunit SRP72-like [Amphiura filiformis]|uniref:LOW QUALITY PROTEIN: signal recognition particle subunit SRP72-like n=1 Tax=Amphiura filiformis TaxID=82378 RepID=UPI003B21F89C
MAATSEAKIASLYSELDRFQKNGDYQKALNTVNKILKEARNDETAFKCKVVCLIQLSQFQQAFKEIVNNPSFASALVFEKAYCQYRLNKINEALSTINAVSEPSQKLKELKGQVLYRLEQYGKCLDVYKDLIKNTSDDFDEERETNLSAVVAAMQLWEGQSTEDLGLKDDTFELCYNKACLVLGQGDYTEALKLLERAEQLCKESLEDDPDMTEEEIEAELGSVRVQKGYILQLQGKTDDAMKIYNQVVKLRPDDIGLMAVASNNIVSLNKDQNVFDSKKKIKATISDNLNHKLSVQQRSAMACNRCLIMVYTNQYDQCRKLLKNIKDKDKESDMPCLLEAALLCREKQYQKAMKLLEEYSNSKEDVSIALTLTRAQIYLMQGNIGQACDVLQSLGDNKHRPGIVSTLVALYANMENTEGAIEALDKAVDWYKSQGGSQSELHTLLRENTNFKIRHGQSEAATSLLEDLRQANPGDIRTLAQLISAYSKFDPKRAQELSQELPPVQEFSGNIDVDTLENTPIFMATRAMKKGAPKNEPAAGDAKKEAEITKKKRKRKKIRYMPKYYDPAVTPDPERWLPIRERSTYKAKRKNKKAGIGKGTQGATAGPNDMDASSIPNSPQAGKPSPKPSSSSGASVPPRQQKPTQATKKKQQAREKEEGGGW